MKMQSALLLLLQQLESKGRYSKKVAFCSSKSKKNPGLVAVTGILFGIKDRMEQERFPQIQIACII
jgi:hypothetical protein